MLILVESLSRKNCYELEIRYSSESSYWLCCISNHGCQLNLFLRIASEWLTLWDFDLNIVYRLGERMRCVNALSRNSSECEVRMIETSNWLLTLQMRDDRWFWPSFVKPWTIQVLSVNPVLWRLYGVLYRRALFGERFVILYSIAISSIKGIGGCKRLDTTVRYVLLDHTTL